MSSHNLYYKRIVCNALVSYKQVYDHHDYIDTAISYIVVLKKYVRPVDPFVKYDRGMDSNWCLRTLDFYLRELEKARRDHARPLYHLHFPRQFLFDF